MYFPASWRRQVQDEEQLPPQTPNSHMSTATIIIIVIAISSLVSLSLGWFWLRSVRRNHDNPKYVPTPFLKNLWTKWEPGKSHHPVPQSDGLEPHRQVTTSRPGTSLNSSTPTIDSAVPRAPGVSGVLSTQELVDRHTSVRSIMTLPAYNPNPLQSEQVLGREGERGGVDVVIEFPEGADEEEANREAEMEALYQVRVARRREIEEREERRRLKREARERGDMVALRELQARSRAPSNASSGPSVDEARAEHARIKKERQRAISSVSYADLGVARHDGTRLRANSNDSERDGLLGNAATMGGSYHRRDHSASSVLTVETMNTDLPSGGGARSRSGSMLSDRPDGPVRRASNRSAVGTPNHERAGSSPEVIEYDDVPPNSPPGYENISLDTPNDGPRSEPPPDYSTSSIPDEESRRISTTSNLDTTTANTDGRRASASHIGQLLLDTVPNNSRASLSARPLSGERRLSSGSVGTPRVPTLTLPTLPSIHIDPGSPSGSISTNHPEN